MNHPQKIIFCDFDGTITAEETFVAMLKKFSPELSAKLMPEMYELRLTLRQGVRQILESIPSKKYPEILEYSSTKKIRPGFVEMLDYLDSQNIPFIVVSGGLRGMVETVLGDLKNRTQGIYAIDVDTSSEYLQVKSEFEAGNELVSKVSIMEKYPTQQTIAIGDSVTDLNMAMEASLVFARDRLSHYLNERKKPYIPWDNFFDIRNYLNKNP